MDRLRHYAICRAAEAQARALKGEPRRDMLLFAMGHATGADRARLLGEAARTGS